MKYEATIGDKVIELTRKGDQLIFNDDVLDFELTEIKTGHYLIRKGDLVHKMELANSDDGTLAVKINGKSTSISIKDEMELILEQLGMDVSQSVSISSISAPMPGSIIDIMVKSGDMIEKDAPVLILEAMKMENVIKSPRDGVISDVQVSLGDNVNKNTELIKFE